jgi:hypothetical protein
MVNLDNESYYSPMGFRTPEYLGFVKFKVVPLFIGTCMYITRTHKPEPEYLNGSLKIFLQRNRSAPRTNIRNAFVIGTQALWTRILTVGTHAMI